MSLHNYGVVPLKNINRVNELSMKMAARNIPSNELETRFQPRSVPTKRILMPVCEEHQPSSVQLKQFPAYEQRYTFNPGSSAPFSGYVNKVDQESSLRNIFFPLQKAGQSQFIPDSHSDLYDNNYLTHTSKPVLIENSRLFEEPHHSNTISPNEKVGNYLFHNHTRQQRCDC
jgi:hypothetical protein